MNQNNRDLALYGAIGGLTAAQAFVMSGDLPHYLVAPIGVVLATLIAIKAKLSQEKPNDPPKLTSIDVVGK